VVEGGQKNLMNIQISLVKPIIIFCRSHSTFKRANKKIFTPRSTMDGA